MDRALLVGDVHCGQPGAVCVVPVVGDTPDAHRLFSQASALWGVERGDVRAAGVAGADGVGGDAGAVARVHAFHGEQAVVPAASRAWESAVSGEARVRGCGDAGGVPAGAHALHRADVAGAAAWVSRRTDCSASGDSSTAAIIPLPLHSPCGILA